jgi:membrane-bound metal-dependent hydrolase YbcI (DUF457 family)
MVVDLDSKKSVIGNYFLFRPLQFVVKHRGFFHSLLFGMIVSLIIYFWNKSASIGFFVGFLSHLFLDCLNLFFNEITKFFIGRLNIFIGRLNLNIFINNKRIFI